MIELPLGGGCSPSPSLRIPAGGPALMPLFATARFPISTGGVPTRCRRGLPPSPRSPAARTARRPHAAPPLLILPSSTTGTSAAQTPLFRHRFVVLKSTRRAASRPLLPGVGRSGETAPHRAGGADGALPPPFLLQDPPPPPPHRGTLRFSGTVYERGGGGGGTVIAIIDDNDDTNANHKC